MPAIRHCEQALATARAFTDPTLTVRVLSTLSQARAAAGDYAQAINDFSELIDSECPRTKKRPSPYVLACKASVLGDLGEFTAAQDCFDEALEHIDEAPQMEGSVLAWRSAVCYWQGRWEEGLEHARRAQIISEKIKSIYVLSMSQALEAYGCWVLKSLPGSLQNMIQATTWLEAQNKQLFISLNHGWLAEALTEACRYNEARVYAARALKRSRCQDRLGESVAYRAIAKLPLKRNGPLHYLMLARDSARARRSRHHEALAGLALAEYQAEHGELSGARRILDEVLVSLEAMAMHWHGVKAEAFYERLTDSSLMP